jgi:selenocysteine lyase/cysteine desulfurase
MTNRRDFFKDLALLSGGVLLPNLIIPEVQHGLDILNKKYIDIPVSSIVTDESYWAQIRQMYTVSSNIINLNNGGVSPQPRVVQEAVERYNRLSNETPSYYMWRILDKGRDALRRNLADLAGCSYEEIAINRNSSEALETVIFGLPLKKGDEVILSYQDYPNMIHAWKQREIRDGIVLKWLDFKFPIEDDDCSVSKFKEQISEKTKLVHITHMINWMGQIMPVKKIAKVSHELGAEVLVDGAHTFAHLDFSIDDLDCDYFGTSLHKWLCAPFGTGLLYVKKDRISKLYPLLASPDPLSDDITKFEHLGTRSFAIEQAIGQAILFHQMIGIEKKQKRLQYLKNYWAEKAKTIEGFSIGTSLKPEYGCAIGLLQHETIPPGKISQYLFNKFGIHTTSIVFSNISGVRITPNVYTQLSELDRLVEALKKMKID